MVDFHSHILPGVDDGSSSVEQSIAMLRLEAQHGISQVVATPHFYANHDFPEKFLRKRKHAESVLREEMAKHQGLPDIKIGAEVYFFPGISEINELDELTISNSRYIMIEMPDAKWTDAMYRELEKIYVRRGMVPIIAHLDRYLAPFGNRAMLKRLGELPVLVQANAEFFLHRSTKNMSLRMLKEDRIHLLGSDCHNMTSRAPNLGDAVERIKKQLGESVLNRLQAYEALVLGEGTDAT